MNLTTFPVCNQCGFSHPPIQTGAKCPMAKEKTVFGEEIKFEEFSLSLKNILLSQIQKKKIKDTKKFLAKIIVEVAKLSEEYKEII